MATNLYQTSFVSCVLQSGIALAVASTVVPAVAVAQTEFADGVINTALLQSSLAGTCAAATKVISKLAQRVNNLFITTSFEFLILQQKQFFYIGERACTILIFTRAAGTTLRSLMYSVSASFFIFLSSPNAFILFTIALKSVRLHLAAMSDSKVSCGFYYSL